MIKINNINYFFSNIMNNLIKKNSYFINRNKENVIKKRLKDHIEN